MATLQEKDWRTQEKAYIKSITPIVNAHVARRANGVKHPVIDFLFEYYHFKPSRLLHWSPGTGIILEGENAGKFLSNPAYRKFDAGIRVDPSTFPRHRIEGLTWIIELLEKTASHPPVFGCLGLHEWCMVYEKSGIRHQELPLRLSHARTREIVETHPVNCSHYDAFRFYSPSARQLNRQAPTRARMPEQEQPGCLHTNMDLYRWSYKFHPWISSGLIGSCFLLALDIRETDMRASPYDLQGYCDKPAIRIETPEGKLEYTRLQREHHERAQPLRHELLESLRELKRLCGREDFITRDESV